MLNGPLTLDAAGQTLTVRDLTLGTAAGLIWTGGGSLIARSINASAGSFDFTSGVVTVAGGTFKPTLRPLAAGTGGPNGTDSLTQTNFALNGVVGGERPVLRLTAGATSVIGTVSTSINVLVGTAGACSSAVPPSAACRAPSQWATARGR